MLPRSQVAGPHSPDVSPEVHGVLLERELGAWYEHGAGKHGLEREEVGGQAGVDRDVVHEAPPHGGGGHVTLTAPDNKHQRSNKTPPSLIDNH